MNSLGTKSRFDNSCSIMFCPFSMFSSLSSVLKKRLILLRAREVLTKLTQSRDGRADA